MKSIFSFVCKNNWFYGIDNRYLQGKSWIGYNI